MQKAARIFLVLVVVVFIGSCHGTDVGPPDGNGGDGGNGGPDLTTTFDVEWDPNTTVIDQEHLGVINNYEEDLTTFEFDADALAAAGLDVSQGRVLFIWGIGPRKVTSSNRLNRHVAVETEPASLAEAIREGTIEWDYGAEFTVDNLVGPTVAGRPVLMTGGPVRPEFAFKYGDYNYDLQLNPSNGGVDFKFTLQKDLPGGTGAKLVAEGYVHRFRNQGSIIINNNRVTRFSNHANHLEGQVTVKLIAAASGTDVVNYTPDLSLFKMPFLVGGLPMSLDVKVQFVINAYVPAAASSNLALKINYDSDLGFSYSAGVSTPETETRSLEKGEEKTDVAAAAAMGANFGLGFPRVELTIGKGVEGTGWIQPAYLLGGSFTFTPPCKEVKGQFIASAGAKVSASIFGKGLEYTIWSKTLHQKEWVLFRSAECPDAAAAGLMAPMAMAQ